MKNNCILKVRLSKEELEKLKKISEGKSMSETIRNMINNAGKMYEQEVAIWQSLLDSMLILNKKVKSDVEEQITNSMEGMLKVLKELKLVTCLIATSNKLKARETLQQNVPDIYNKIVNYLKSEGVKI